MYVQMVIFTDGITPKVKNILMLIVDLWALSIYVASPAYLLYPNCQPATHFPLTATLARLVIPVLSVKWKVPWSDIT